MKNLLSTSDSVSSINNVESLLYEIYILNMSAVNSIIFRVDRSYLCTSCV